MPSLYHLNAPPNPFWTFVHDLEDHPFFAGRAGPPGHHASEHVAPEAAEASGSGEQAREHQPTAEDPPEVDPATLNANDTGNQPQSGPWAGRGRFFNPFEGEDAPPRRGHGCRGRGGPMGPPPFMFGGGPWWGRHLPGMEHPEHPHPHPHPHPHEDGHHGAGPHHHGPPPHGPPHHGPGPHHRGPPGHHRGRGGCNRRQSAGGRGGQAQGFNLGEFLNNLGDRLGVDLSGAAENLGLDRFSVARGNTNADSDFEPRGDIFDTASEYIVHLSLPGAKKSDVGVDWDGENSVLRVAGVVHRPGADEELLSKLVVDQRKREVGVFEKNIRLGTRRDPASIDVGAISAKMLDGVLVVRVPKVARDQRKRDVPITGSPARDENAKAGEKPAEKEKESLLDAADEEMYDAAAAAAAAPVPNPAVAPDVTEKKILEKEQIAAHAYQPQQQQQQQQPEQDVRSETMDVEQHDHHEEVPAYEESDWEKDGSEDEGEYVKINVD